MVFPSWRGAVRSIDCVINRREWLPGSADEGYAEHGYVAAVERADPG
jgi:hypothetical protein